MSAPVLSVSAADKEKQTATMAELTEIGGGEDAGLLDRGDDQGSFDRRDEGTLIPRKEWVRTSE